MHHLHPTLNPGHLKPNGALTHGSMALVAKTFGCHRNNAREIWRRHQDGTVVQRGGSKPRYDAATLKAAVASVDVLERQTVRAAAAAISIPKSTMQDYIKPDGCLRRRTANVKPTLTDAQRLDRVRFALAHVQCPLGLRRRYFVDMYDTVHVDEKWFYIHQASSKFILTEDEDIPHITCPNKRLITKVMFLAAVARPRYDYKHSRGFTGKIGIFPIVGEHIAKRTTQNQTKGDTILVPKSVDKEVYYDLLTTQLLPAIQATWQWRKTIRLQQDNASPHIVAERAIADAGLADEGWRLTVCQQPAKSPDLNILDLGFFRAIQSVQHTKRAYSIASLIAAVDEAFKEMEVRTLEKCFLTLQAVMEEIMLERGQQLQLTPRLVASFP